MLPLHHVVSKFGVPLVKSITKAHILTCNDSMSKLETKHAAIVSYPLPFLERFGETDKHSKDNEVKAADFFVKVWVGERSTTHASAFNKLRVGKQ